MRLVRAIRVASAARPGGLSRHIVGCNVYVSDGQSTDLLQQLRDLARSGSSRVALVASFTDAEYHRSSFTLASDSTQQLCACVLALARHALAHIDMTRHDATHPRLGAVDHVSCHPVTPATPMALAVDAAKTISAGLSTGPRALPVYLYGAAHPQGRSLAELRRQLGYFQAGASVGSTAGGTVWSGLQLQCGGSGRSSAGAAAAAAAREAVPLAVPPDSGPHEMSPVHGVSTIGAVPWLVNFNVPLLTDDLAAAKQVARSLSQRGGGMAAVEAMALVKGEGVIEVACNLLDPAVSPPAAVFERVQQLAAQRQLRYGQPYRIGLAADEVAAQTEQLLRQLDGAG